MISSLTGYDFKLDVSNLTGLRGHVAIQIMRDTLGEGGGGTASCHQITQGGGKRSAKV
jgi:hypothetical protein